MEKPNILLVDDNPDNIYLLEVILQSRDFNTLSAFNGRQAVELVEKSRNIDLVLMDVMMPEMDGFEASRRIRNRPESAHIPIIMMTAKKRELSDVLRGLDEGAVEYLTKPFEEEELLARVKSMLRIKKLHDHNRELLDKVLKQQKVLDMEMETAKKVQYAMLPSPASYPGREKCLIDAYYRAAISIGGDLYDFMEYGPGRAAFIIADVSGHGPSAAMITAVLKTILINECVQRPSPAELLRRINSKVMAIIPEDHFITAFIGVADFTAGALTYSRAGHPPAFLFGDSRESLHELDAEGTILGFFDDAEFEEKTVPFAKGDKLFLYSDGIFETQGKEKGLYGMARLKNFILAHRGETGHVLLEKLNAEVDAYWDGETVRDDVAEAVVEFL